MRRIKVLLAVVAAVAMMMVLAAPAWAHHRDNGCFVVFDGLVCSDDGGTTVGSDGISQTFDIDGVRGGGSANQQGVVLVGSHTGDISLRG
jgi:hypothetical protein